MSFRKFSGMFPINQMFSDMRKVPVEELRKTNVEGAANHYGVTQETVMHWIKIIIETRN